MVLFVIILVIVIFTICTNVARREESNDSTHTYGFGDSNQDSYQNNCEETIQDQHVLSCLARFCHEVQWIREHHTWNSGKEHSYILIRKNSNDHIDIRAEYEDEGDGDLHNLYKKYNRNDHRFLGMSIHDELYELLIYELKGIDERDSIGEPDLYLNISTLVEAVKEIGKVSVKDV